MARTCGRPCTPHFRRDSPDCTALRLGANILICGGPLCRRVSARVELGRADHVTQRDYPGGILMIDHVYISVTDIGRSMAFYSAALEPLGWRELGNYDSSSGPDGVPDLYGLADDAYGGGVAVGASIWLRRREAGETGLYVGFVADDHATVKAAYTAAINAGGTDEGKPAVRSYFGPGYYAANVGDFDGNHLEIVNKSFNPRSRHSA
jgi:catechol 2,3-dioxygenase-like lactoylglutathione lyase family enzyme